MLHSSDPERSSSSSSMVTTLTSWRTGFKKPPLLNTSLIGRSTSSFCLSLENTGANPSPAFVSLLTGLITCPQPLALPSFTICAAALYEEIDDLFLLVDSSSNGFSGRCVPSMSFAVMKEKLDKWLISKACSPLMVTNFPFTVNFNFWWRVEVTAPASWIHGLPSRQL